MSKKVIKNEGVGNGHVPEAQAQHQRKNQKANLVCRNSNLNNTLEGYDLPESGRASEKGGGSANILIVKTGKDRNDY